jgi:hypothetical protein
MDQQTPAFDASRPITVQLLAATGVKTVRVRFPSGGERSL